MSNVINKLNDSGKLPTILDRFMSRFDAPKPDGKPIRQWTEDDYSKLNEKLNQKENLYSQQINPEKSEEKPSDYTIRQAQNDHLTGKPMPMEITFEAEKKRLKEEFGMTDDEVSQLIGNVKSQKEMNQILGKLEKIKNGN